MPFPRNSLEQQERDILATYAQFSGSSRGRQYPEESAPWRTEYQRDRDRVIHSRAFRRLEYKTQVFLNGSGDHFRTRLTHTIEVAAIARNMARALRLNEDLAETIALAHDLGHSPFGHTGEDVLNRLMQDFGGFEHNRQSLRIVEELEQKYPGFPGLNLTWEVREGLNKHHTEFDHPESDPAFPGPSASLEAQAADLADEIAYYSHDLDDGLDSGLLNEEELQRHVTFWRYASESVEREHGILPDECRWYFIIRCIIDQEVRDVVTTTEEAIKSSGVRTADEARQRETSLVQYSATRREWNQELRLYLYANLYANPKVCEPNRRSARLLEHLFGYYRDRPQELGRQSRDRLRHCGPERAICDYLSGMTDRFALLDYQRLAGELNA